MSNSANVIVRCRPVRLAFLIRPDSLDDLNLAIEACTCSWGGIFNPILSAHEDRPQGSEVYEPHKPYKEIIRGYLEVFRPDFLVFVDESLRQYAVELNRPVLSYAEVLADDGVRTGLDVRSVYDHLYSTVFRFQLKQEPDFLAMVHPEWLEPIAGPIFGRFPSSQSSGVHVQTYEQVFPSRRNPLAPGGLLARQVGECADPLWLTKYAIRTFTPRCRGTEWILLYDAQNIQDSLDLWNLRALRGGVLALPVSLLDECAGALSILLQQMVQRRSKLPAGIGELSIVLSRRIQAVGGEEAWARRGKHPAIEGVVRAHFPRIWRPECLECDDASPAELSSGWGSGELRAGEHAHLPVVSPTFDPNPSRGVQPCWMNTISIRSGRAESEVCATFPALPNAGGDVGPVDDPWNAFVTEEGARIEDCEIVVPIRSAGGGIRLKGETTLSIARRYFAAHGYTVSQSHAGSIAAQFIAQLGGMFGVPEIANVELIKLFTGDSRKQGNDEGDAAKTHAAEDVANSPVQSLPRETVGEFTPKTLRGVLHRHWPGERVCQIEHGFRSSGILLAGFKPQCPTCNSTPWIPFDDWGETVHCPLCRTRFLPVPTNKQDTFKTIYRPGGAAAVRGSAQGAFTVALAISFLCHALGTGFRGRNPSYATAIELKKTNSKEKTTEMDFLLWAPREGPSGPMPPGLVLGECKTFLGVPDVEMDKVIRYLEVFPSAYVVFATLLDPNHEKSKPRFDEMAVNLRKRAEARRRKAESEGCGLGIILLTRSELACPHGLPESWTEHEKALRGHVNSLEDIARITQKLYLGIDFFDSGNAAGAGEPGAKK